MANPFDTRHLGRARVTPLPSGFTSPDRQFGTNADRVPDDEPIVTGGPDARDPDDISAEVPPDDGRRSAVAVTRAVLRPADAPQAARPAEVRERMTSTPPMPRNGGGNGYDPSK